MRTKAYLSCEIRLLASLTAALTAYKAIFLTWEGKLLEQKSNNFHYAKQVQYSNSICYKEKVLQEEISSNLRENLPPLADQLLTLSHTNGCLSLIENNQICTFRRELIRWLKVIQIFVISISSWKVDCTRWTDSLDWHINGSSENVTGCTVTYRQPLDDWLDYFSYTHSWKNITMT